MMIKIMSAITLKAPLLEILIKIERSLYKFTRKVNINTKMATHVCESFEKQRISVTGYSFVLKIEFIRNMII
jgi:hypothetical protein